ncbi:hypothetical protein HF521_008095 [Silurus meridionalis]|uniref:Uncharacterized protein n=1 Tax=Silurus meridionalis TaxID=175797 RepID=A0A8T0AN32_SILME|nr:hypothetical protein HF521_008095 [Silurus meridionalis]
MLSLTDLKRFPDIAGCILEKQQDFNSFLEIIEMKKSHDALLFASEISYTYSSWAPKIETGKVLKIIGSSSEDGNTLSGYTGTQLASLMTKAQRAALFSICSTFRNDFINVFSRIHDVNVVLEITMQNQHVYQIDDTGTSVENQVPKRPVDHSTQYDKQHILIMQDDPVVRDVVKYLYGKHPDVSSVYMLENEKPKLTELHLRRPLRQVTHTGQKNIAEINPNGFNWKHNDDSKKVVLTLDKNDVTQIQPGNRAKAMFTTERNILGNNIDSWPEKPQRFVSEGFRKKHTDDLEALSWAFFQHRKGSWATAQSPTPSLRRRPTLGFKAKARAHSLRHYFMGRAVYSEYGRVRCENGVAEGRERTSWSSREAAFRSCRKGGGGGV